MAHLDREGVEVDEISEEEEEREGQSQVRAQQPPPTTKNAYVQC
jgi:hypothetical protein